MGLFNRRVSQPSSSSHHDHVAGRRHSKPAPKEEPADGRRKIVLRDLDDNAADLTVLVAPSATLGKVAASIRKQLERSSGEPSDQPSFAFYDYGKPRALDNIPDKPYILYYHAIRDSIPSIDISATPRLNLTEADLQEISADVDAGSVIGGLRRKIAECCEVDDPNRIILIANGGFRPGRLQGNAWEARGIKQWLCRSLVIDLAPPRQYLVFKGLNQEYLYHPEHLPGNRGFETRALKYWLKESILLGVGQNPGRRVKVDGDDIRLSRRGRLLRDRSQVSMAHYNILEFELTRRVEDRFVTAEAWLVPCTTTCSLCCDDKRASDMPKNITAGCEHTPTTCKDCVTQWIETSLNTTSWDRLKCPECPSLLKFGDIRRQASIGVFNRYDMLATKAKLSSIPHFKWCLARGCEAGQIHRASCPKVICHSCKSISCANHDVPWHRGETCDEYDHRTRKQRRNDKASEKTVKSIAKPCPKCNKNVHKFDGCDHITCVCGHEWCYLCLAPYTRDDQNMLHCQHKRTCLYFAYPPPYEVGFDPFNARPWMPRPPPVPMPRRRPGQPPRPLQNNGDPFNFLADFGLPRDPFAPGARPRPADHMADAIAAMHMHIAAAHRRQTERDQGPRQPIDDILLNIFGNGENLRPHA